jgi:uncharacterized protein YqeY
MAGNPAKELKDRLRADLKHALKGGRKGEMSLLRALLAAIDNAEAPPRSDAELRYDPDAASEIARLELSREQLQQLLASEREDRLNGAAQMDRVGQPESAERLRAEAETILRYVD